MAGYIRDGKALSKGIGSSVLDGSRADLAARDVETLGEPRSAEAGQIVLADGAFRGGINLNGARGEQAVEFIDRDTDFEVPTMLGDVTLEKVTLAATGCGGARPGLAGAGPSRRDRHTDGEPIGCLLPTLLHR